jgi:hypothetical protein
MSVKSGDLSVSHRVSSRPVLDYSEGSGKFLWSVPDYFQHTRRHKPEDLYRQHYCVNLKSHRPVFTEWCNGYVVDVLIPVDFPLPDTRSRLGYWQFEFSFLLANATVRNDQVWVAVIL